jgi:hypothetical protein
MSMDRKADVKLIYRYVLVPSAYTLSYDRPLSKQSADNSYRSNKSLDIENTSGNCSSRLFFGTTEVMSGKP